MKLETVKQLRNKGPQEFADRCRALVQKIVCKADDLQMQRVHQENAERMLLAAFVLSLIGVPEKQCRFSNPQTMQQSSVYCPYKWNKRKNKSGPMKTFIQNLKLRSEIGGRPHADVMSARA
jgi:hypothetical protein